MGTATFIDDWPLTVHLHTECNIQKYICIVWYDTFLISYLISDYGIKCKDVCCITLFMAVSVYGLSWGQTYFKERENFVGNEIPKDM